MSETSLELIEIEKTYESSGFRLGPINLQLEQAQVLGLLGKNGAGKSTLFQILSANSNNHKGILRLNGKKLSPEDPNCKRAIGYLPQALELPKWVNARELLNYAIKLYELDHPSVRSAEALDFWDCQDFAHKPLAACSHGMQKRVALALATIHNPKLLILDEPFSGLDLFHIKALHDVIESRIAKGQMTILSTHIAPYAARLCNRVLLLKQGELHFIEGWSEKNALDRIAAVESFFFPE